jgi:hypothetical protein
MRAYEGETCTIYRANWGLFAQPLLIWGMISSIFGLFILIAIGAEWRRTGTISDTWWQALPLLALLGGVIAYNLVMLRRRPLLLISAGGIGYITPNCSLWTDWANVERLDLQALPVLILRQPGAMTGWCGGNQLFGETWIPLWVFDYAPRSALGNDLRARAPHLFQ